MAIRGTFSGVSLALRLSTIALVPMVALAGLSIDRVSTQETSAEMSRELADDIATRRDVASVIAPAALERVALLGLAQIDSLGIDRSVVTEITGVDLPALLDANTAAFDGALFDLRTANDKVTLADGSVLHLRLADTIRDLRDLREQNVARSGDPAAIDRVFDEIDDVLGLGLAQIDTTGVESTATLLDIDRLQSVGTVLTTAADMTRVSADGFITAGDSQSAVLDIATSWAVHTDRVAALAEQLDPADRAALRAITDNLTAPPTELLVRVERPDATTNFDPGEITSIAALLWNQIEYIEALESFSADLHSRALADATIRSTAATSDAQTTRLVVGLIGLSAVLIILFVMFTTARPLIRLSRRAAEISDGEISGEPLPIRGPRVVRGLTQSMNDMVVTLSGVNEQIGKMSDGDVAGAVDVELPGAIGVSMRQSVARLSNMTEELAHQARHDLLTGLPNRYATMEVLDDLLSRAVPFTLLFVDIDGFKGVNDTHGHSAGDDVLRSVASRLAQTVGGSFVARLGGDEFVIVVADPTLETAVALGHSVIDRLEVPYHVSSDVFVLSASVGVVGSEANMTALDVLHRADSALYLAKQRGRGRVELFDARLQASIEHEADLALALRHGIRNGELELHLQPILNVVTNRMDHAEALVRWNRPGVGLVPPGDFIPIAERSSLIFEIEQWVLRQTCEILAEQRTADPSFDISIAVNISGRHLIDGDLLDDLEASLAATGADPTLLEFELTETRLLEDLDLATTILNTIRARGISIAVDDFGTGYSSMNYLRDLPIDTIKIDRSFVSRATERGYDSTVIEAVITIADTLQLGVVAEGIETTEQLDYVIAAGCHRAQGFLLARPMPADDALQLITRVTVPN